MNELTILERGRRMPAGELTARTLSEWYLERIDRLDARGPLPGVPILVKDNIDTHDRMQTTAGSSAPEGSIAPRDAFSVERLRAASAVILGKTNLSELANFRGERSVSGWSSRGGLKPTVGRVSGGGIVPVARGMAGSDGRLLAILHYEFKADLNRYLASRGPGAPVRSIGDAIAFNDEHAAQVMPFFGQEHMIAARGCRSLATRPYREARARSRRRARQEGIDVALRQHRLSALVTCSGGPAWTIDLVNGHPSTCDVQSTSAAAVSSYPHITVPAGHVHGLRVGVSFIARAWQEATLTRLAHAFEQATQVRVPPRFAAHAEVGGVCQSWSRATELHRPCAAEAVVPPKEAQ